MNPRLGIVSTYLLNAARYWALSAPIGLDVSQLLLDIKTHQSGLTVKVVVGLGVRAQLGENYGGQQCPDMLHLHWSGSLATLVSIRN